MKFRQYTPDPEHQSGLQEWEVSTLAEFLATPLALAFSDDPRFSYYRLSKGHEHIEACYHSPGTTGIIATVLSDPLPEWVAGTPPPPSPQVSNPTMMFAHLRQVLADVSEGISYGGPGPTDQDVAEAISHLITLERRFRNLTA